MIRKNDTPALATLSGVDLRLDLIVRMAWRLRATELAPLPIKRERPNLGIAPLTRYQEDCLIRDSMVAAQRMTMAEAAMQMLYIGGESENFVVRLRTRDDVWALANAVVSLIADPQMDARLLTADGRASLGLPDVMTIAQVATPEPTRRAS